MNIDTNWIHDNLPKTPLFPMAVEKPHILQSESQNSKKK